jgi:uncharacterized Tic20 family protein
MSEIDNLTAPPPSAGEGPPEDRSLGLITHLLGIVSGFIGALVIWLIHKDKPEKAWLNDQAKEALNFQITLMIAYFVAGLLTIVLIGIFLIPIIWIANLAFCIIGGMKANSGVAYRYPVTLRLIK